MYSSTSMIDYMVFWTNVLKYEFDYSESKSAIPMSTEYDYSISAI